MTAQSNPVTHAEISRRAFVIWCESGRQPGMDAQNWRAAERELQREREHKELNASQNAQDQAN